MPPSTKKKVLQVGKLYPPVIGGVETWMRDLSEGLVEYCDVDVLVCNQEGRHIEENVNGVCIHRAGCRHVVASTPLSFDFVRTFLSICKEYDCVHIHMPYPLADVACCLSDYQGKVVLWWHSDVIRQKKLMRLYKPFMNRLLNRADSIVVATEGHIDGSAYLPPYRDKCRVIPFGLDIEKYDNAKSDPLLTCQLSNPSAKKVLFVGRLVYYKGIDVLLEAFRGMKAAELFIVGKGPLEEEVRSFSKNPDMVGKVHLFHGLTTSELLAAYQDCDLLVLPSVERSEAFGLVQLEAMVYSKPVINTSLSSGVPYVSVHRKTGITVAPRSAEELHEALVALVNDDELRMTLGNNARKRVLQEFDLKRSIERTNNLYQELLNER